MDIKKSRIAEKLRIQSIKSVMDVLMLAEIRNGAMSGYDAIGYIHEKFGVLLSSGTVYSHLYALEREGLIVSNYNVATRVYELTEKGKQALEIASKTNLELLETINDILNP